MARFMARFDLLVTPTLAVLPFSAEIDDPTEIAGRAVRPGDWAPFPVIANLTGPRVDRIATRYAGAEAGVRDAAVQAAGVGAFSETSLALLASKV